MASARDILLGTTRVHRERIHLRTALLTGLLAILVTCGCIWGAQPSWALPLVLGIAFVGLAESSESPDVRLRVMLWTLLWITAGTALGGLVSSWAWPELIVVGVVGLVGGFAGALGSRGSLIGVLSMVTYTVFAGVPDSATSALTAAFLVALGGIVMIVATLTPVLLLAPATLSHRTERPEPVTRRLREHRRRDDVFAHHALRLSIALVIGSFVAHNLAWPHQYWIPMTIVWMSRPDTNGTATRVVERILGTVVGVALSVVTIEWISSTSVAVAIYTGLGTFLLLAFIQANYPIAVAGVTWMIVTLFFLLGDTVGSTAPSRIGSTLLAGVITMALALTLWRRSPTS